MTVQALDEQKLGIFMSKILGDLSATMISLLCNIGDRLGLFKWLASSGPATVDEFATGCGINPRYAEEWLRALTSAGYLEYDAAAKRFHLPPEHAMALADEGGPMFIGGTYHQLPALVAPLDLLTQAFKYGGGVPQSAYPSTFWDGFERFSGTWFRNFLVQDWVPAVPDVQEKLSRGALVADIGCGRGQALIALARAFPESRFVGFDAFEPTIGTARANAQSAGVADRVTFECLDVVGGFPETYDLITAFDVLHDMADPSGALNAIRHGLRPDGTFLCLEMNSSNNPDENIGPVAAILYSVSTLYCMTTSLAAGGLGLGAAGLPEARLREFAQRSGFGSVRRLPIQNPFNILYEIKP
jgi:SAM-dependent methyltransferase